MSEITSLEPRLVWEQFDAITRVPRPSKKEGKIIDFLVDFAKKHHIEYKKDAIGNVVMRKPATPGMEERAAVILQSHMDMVCEKNAGVTHDFAKDPISFEIEGDKIIAKETTLGADDGIGVALALAVLADESRAYPPLEFVCTADEERGMTGVEAFDGNLIQGSVLINLDSDDEGIFIIGCAGGGSNLGGLISPFMGEKLRGERDYRFIAVEPASCPSLTRGRFAYDFCDTGKVCPLAKMYTLGSGFIPSPSHAGGLRYHGMSPVLSQLYHDGYMEARAVGQTQVFEAATVFARTEGILPAPESSHAIRVAIDEALKCKETGEEKTILFGLTGTGYFDMTAYQRFNDGEMSDYIPTDEELERAFASLPEV